MGKRELVALLNLSSWCLVMVERLFHAVPRGFLRFVLWYFLIILTIFSLCAISTQISNNGPNIANPPTPPPPPTHTHTNLRCIDFLICAGESTYWRFMVLVVPDSALDLAAVCYRGISWLCSFTFSKRNLIKGHLLKSNDGSDICFAIMHTLHGLYKMFKWVSKLH